MEEIIFKLESWKSDIEFDINQDWNEQKIKNTLQLFRIEQAISLLKNLGDNDNIPK